MEPVQSRWSRKSTLALMGAVAGLLYGIGLRLLALFHASGSDFRLEIMSVGFIILMPFAMGFITIAVAEIRQPQPIWKWCLLPWVPLFGALAAMVLMRLEGWICIVMFTPLALVVATIGGLAGGVSGRVIRSRRTRNLTLTCIVVLPLFTATWEKPVFYELQSRRVDNVIDIQASPEVVWKNIERVPAIQTSELPKSWTRKIGFPDPVEATLSHEGVGGVRNASFAGGLLFIETVDVWEPQQRLAFAITPQTDKIPATTLDEHVRVGGPYFDVLRGEYRLEPLPNGITRLHLSSSQRVSTDFNWYAHLWTDAVMSDLQQRILYVIKNRCEKKMLLGASCIRN